MSISVRKVKRKNSRTLILKNKSSQRSTFLPYILFSALCISGRLASHTKVYCRNHTWDFCAHYQIEVKTPKGKRVFHRSGNGKDCALAFFGRDTLKVSPIPFPRTIRRVYLTQKPLKVTVLPLKATVLPLKVTVLRLRVTVLPLKVTVLPTRSAWHRHRNLRKPCEWRLGRSKKYLK